MKKENNPEADNIRKLREMYLQHIDDNRFPLVIMLSMFSITFSCMFLITSLGVMAVACIIILCWAFFLFFYKKIFLKRKAKNLSIKALTKFFDEQRNVVADEKDECIEKLKELEKQEREFDQINIDLVILSRLP